MKESGIGCKIGNNYLRTIAYADDITLMSPSLSGLQKLIDICCKFNSDFHVKINDSKTVCIEFGRVCERNKDVYLDGNVLKWDNNVKHLGNMLSRDLTDKCDITMKRGKFYSSVNKVISLFGFLHSNVKQKLFNSYCTSFYGSQIWDLSCKTINEICIAWNKAVRRIWNLSTRCHTSLLKHIAGQLYIMQQLELRYVKMFVCMLNSANTVVKATAKRSYLLTSGAMGRNNVHISNKYNIPIDCIDLNAVKCAISNSEACDATYYVGKAIVELCMVRDGFHIIDSENIMNSIGDLIEALCTK